LSARKVAQRHLSIGLGLVAVVLSVIVILLVLGVIPQINTQAKLVNVGLGGTYYPAGKLLQGQQLSSNSLQISGWVCNAGSLTAYNSKLHVVVTDLAPNGTPVTLIDTYLKIGNDYPLNGIVDGFESVYVNSVISYPSNISDPGTWRITPSWTGSP
jgi:hypothetical protein